MGVMAENPMEVQSFFAKKLLHDVGGGGEEGKTYNLCPSGRPTVKVICSNF